MAKWGWDTVGRTGGTLSVWKAWYSKPCHRGQGPRDSSAAQTFWGALWKPWLYQKRLPKPRTVYVNGALKLPLLWSTTEGLGEVRGGAPCRIPQ